MATPAAAAVVKWNPTALQALKLSEAQHDEVLKVVADLGVVKATLDGLTITDGEGAKRATESVAFVVDLHKHVEALREKVNRPHLDAKAANDAALMPITKACDQVRAAADARLLEWRKAERKREAEAEQDRQRQLAKVAAQVQAQAVDVPKFDASDPFAPAPKPVAIGDTPALASAMVAAGATPQQVAEAVVPQVEQAPRSVVTAYGTSGFVGRWTVEVVDLAKAAAANPQLFELDKSAALALRKGLGITEDEPEGQAGKVPGLRFFREESTSFRG